MTRRFRIEDAIATLLILVDQMKANNLPTGELDELVILPDNIKLKRGTKTLTIPTVEVKIK